MAGTKEDAERAVSRSSVEICQAVGRKFSLWVISPKGTAAKMLCGINRGHNNRHKTAIERQRPRRRIARTAGNYSRGHLTPYFITPGILHRNITVPAASSNLF
jgi:hypothetical protein